jgi:hypothetical protein
VLDEYERIVALRPPARFTMNDWRDLALETAATDHVELLAQLQDVRSDRDTYRELAQLAIQALHTLTQKHKNLRDQMLDLTLQTREHRREDNPRQAA